MNIMWIHRLTNKNLQTKTAVCSSCGEVGMVKKGKLKSGSIKYRCKNAVRVYAKTYGNRHKYHEPNPGVCCLCGDTRRVSYDHCHETGRFRGWLCINCNTALGLMHDDVEKLQQLIDYVLRHQAGSK